MSTGKEKDELDVNFLDNSIVRSEEKSLVLNSIEEGSNASCPVCRHKAAYQATQVYFDNNNSAEAVQKWFYSKYRKTLVLETISKHFKEHVEPFVTQFMISKERKIKALQQNASTKERNSTSKLALIQAMLFDMITDAYSSKPEQIATKEERNNYRTTAKMVTDLAKSFKDIFQLEFEIMGYGKTEEEQKETMKNYMTAMLKQTISAFSDMPDAQKRLASILKITVEEEKGEPETVVEEEDNG